MKKKGSVKRRHKPKPRKSAQATTIGSRPRIVKDTSIVDGFTVIASRTPIRIVDHRNDTHILKASESLSFRPIPVGAGELRHTEIPGFRQAPPSSVLWLDISGDRDKAVTLTLDAGGLLRNAARWGRPVILACASSDKASSRWTIVGSRQQFAIRAGAHLLVVGIGHGIPVDPASVFSSLLQAAVVRRPKSSKHGGRSDAE